MKDIKTKIDFQNMLPDTFLFLSSQILFPFHLFFSSHLILFLFFHLVLLIFYLLLLIFHLLLGTWFYINFTKSFPHYKKLSPLQKAFPITKSFPHYKKLSHYKSFTITKSFPHYEKLSPLQKVLPLHLVLQQKPL